MAISPFPIKTNSVNTIAVEFTDVKLQRIASNYVAMNNSNIQKYIKVVDFNHRFM